MNIELYNRLCKARQNLRERYAKVGKTPVICRDEELISIAELKPRRKEDLIYINGLGQAFMEKYGDVFIKVVRDYYSELSTEEEIDNDIRDTLKNYEKRLININKRNRLLYCGKLYSSSLIDLYSDNNPSFNQNLIKLIQNKISSLELCNTSSIDGMEKYRKISILNREVLSLYREKGDYDLYIGYPFVEGYFEEDDFKVRAPLVLFPVNLERTSKNITISINYSKDILYNNILILLNNKYHQKNASLPLDVVEDVNGDFLKDTILHYQDSGINIELDNENKDIEKYQDIDKYLDIYKYLEYSKDDFPTYRNEQFKLVPNMVLGRFSFFSNAIQKDYKVLIGSENIPSLLFNLLSENNHIHKIVQNSDISEKDLNYISDLDGSQEKVIYQMNNLESLVVEGPPGTGKSQTITNLIIDAVSKEKNILMVSEKKAALEVIYSRLGNLSKYAIMLSDVNDKDSFYQQLANLMNDSLIEHEDIKEDINNLSNNIDNELDKLSLIKKVLYENKINNVPAIQIYQENVNNSIREIGSLNKYLIMIDDLLLNGDYNDLKAAREIFSKSSFLLSCLNVEEIKNKYPWIDSIKALSFDENITFIKSVNDFYLSHNQYLKKPSLFKIFLVGKEKRSFRKIISTYFNNSNYYKHLYRYFDEFRMGVNRLNFYLDDLLNYNTLTDFQKLYLRTFYKLNIANLNVSNNLLFDIIINHSMSKFSYENRDIIKIINEYPSIVDNIINLIEQKSFKTNKMISDELHNHYYLKIGESKRFNEIKRGVESKRKSSIGRFINKYQFELFKGIKIWLMTPETVSELLPLERNSFDLLIFDEASQIYIEKALPAIYRATKVVISGDTKQLNPSSLGFAKFDEGSDDLEFNENMNLEEKSLLDLAKYRYSEILLNYHYRSKYEELINFSNAGYYNFNLNVSPNIIKPLTPPIEVIKVDDGTFIKRKNIQEGIKAVQLIKEILNQRTTNDTIGVITFNSNQRDLIEDLLDEEYLRDPDFAGKCISEINRTDNGEDTGLFIKNIENVQGDERDIIIFVVGYAKGENGRISTNFGWLNQLGGENRLNVAASRAKKKIFVITSITPNELEVDDSKNQGPKLFKKYLEYAYAISNQDNQTARNVLSSLTNSLPKQNDFSCSIFENELYEALYDAIDQSKYSLDREVGNSKYHISIGIKDKLTNSYLLGIICDNDLSNNNITTKERDIFRYKYLKSRGWEIMHIWSVNWCKSPIDEINKIMDKLSSLHRNL